MLRRSAAFFVALVVAVVLGRSFLLPDTGLAFFWPPAGVLCLWGLMVRSRAEKALAVGLMTLVMTGMAAQGHFSPLAGALLILNNLMVMAVPAILLALTYRRQLTLRELCGSPVAASRFVLAATAGALLSAVFAGLAIAAGGGRVTLLAVVAHVVRNLASVLLITGLGIAIGGRSNVPHRLRWKEAIGLAVLTTALAALIFGWGVDLPLAHALLLPLFWSASRLVPWAAMLHALYTAVLTVPAVIVFGPTAFGANLHPSALASRMQLFMVLGAALSLMISTAMAESHQLATTLRASEESALQQAERDALTGLLNRHGFEAVLAEAGARLADGEDSSLVLLDLDHFKDVNDTLGHAAGDALLTDVARSLTSSVRSTDRVARLGGDEFAVVLLGSGIDAGRRVAQHAVASIADVARRAGGQARHVTASAGVVSLQHAAEQGTDPLALADMLMYDAKESGRNQVAAQDGWTPTRLGQRLGARDRIERALESGAFELHLQPILHLATSRVTAAEALIRLREDGRLVPPADFLPYAEQTGLGRQIDAWVAGEAVRLLTRLRAEQPAFRLSANVSGPSLGDPGYMAALHAALDAHRPPPGQLLLEVTETTAVTDLDRARDFARRLAQRGVGLALDDFGAGYGSFHYLRALEFDVLKIDGQFVEHILESPADQAIVRSLVGVARDLGKLTVAEYVTSPETLAAVRELGVDLAQGFGIGRPVPVDEFIETHLTTSGGRP